MPGKNANDISLATGSLSKKEIDAILNALPLDITFVGPKDEVRYFNRLGKRIFPRTKEVIGRKVRDCHPPKSIAKVEEILSGFRSGKRDSAEFWIGLKGRSPLKEGVAKTEGERQKEGVSRRLQSLVHIRYFAVRNPKGRYLGCLEVSQDITEIKGLEGEKRLL